MPPCTEPAGHGPLLRQSPGGLKYPTSISVCRSAKGDTQIRAFKYLVLFAAIAVGGVWYAVVRAEEEPLLGKCYQFYDPWHWQTRNKITLANQQCDHKQSCGMTMICDQMQTLCPDPLNTYPYTHVGDEDVIAVGSCRYLLYHQCNVCTYTLVCYRRRAYRDIEGGACQYGCPVAYYEGRTGACID